jgi:hypothetical protein
MDRYFLTLFRLEALDLKLNVLHGKHCYLCQQAHHRHLLFVIPSVPHRMLGIPQRFFLTGTSFLLTDTELQQFQPLSKFLYRRLFTA